MKGLKIRGSWIKTSQDYDLNKYINAEGIIILGYYSHNGGSFWYVDFYVPDHLISSVQTLEKGVDEVGQFDPTVILLIEDVPVLSKNCLALTSKSLYHNNQLDRFPFQHPT
jgi:hypothetical protein